MKNNTVDLAHYIYANTDIDPLKAVAKAEKLLNRIIDKDTNKISKDDLNEFFKEIGKIKNDTKQYGNRKRRWSF